MLRVIPLGGLGEVGMNALALEQRGEVLLVDCGVTFDDRGLGVDVVHPSFDALEAYRDRIRGVVVTHGHEDHIGALPYFLRRFDVPVWGPPYALGLVKERLSEHEILAHATLIETHPRAPFMVGSFRVEPIRVTHSIADATALAITTDQGVVVHTGDFKFDESPPDGEAFDVARLSELGDAGVSLLMSDSTNIDARAETAGSERGVGEVLERLVAGATGAVVVGVFASNVHRLRMLGDIARKTGRKLVPLGRSVHTHSRVARATGYLEGASGGGVDLFPPERTRELPRDQILGVATGTQAEARAALARLARGDHPTLTVGEGDTVIFSSRVIPGHEPEVYALMSDLLRRGVSVRSWITDAGVHVSGHAHRAEQRRMLELVRPKAFMPLHGTLHHLTRHAQLATEVGVQQVSVLENGDVGLLDEAGFRKGPRVPSGRVHIAAGRALAPSVLRERMAIAAEGVVLVAVQRPLRMEDGAEVALVGRGVFGEHDAQTAANARSEARAAADLVLREQRHDNAESGHTDPARQDDALAEAVRLAVRRHLHRALGWKPVTVVSVLRTRAQAHGAAS